MPTSNPKSLIELPKPSENHQYFKTFKPYGFLSQFLPEARKKKHLLGELFNFPDKIMAIGRLDHDSEGLLLLTTDGMMSYKVRGKGVEKEYYVQVDGVITLEAIEQLQSGVEIGINGVSNVLPDIQCDGRRRSGQRTVVFLEKHSHQSGLNDTVDI